MSPNILNSVKNQNKIPVRGVEASGCNLDREVNKISAIKRDFSFICFEVPKDRLQNKYYRFVCKKHIHELYVVKPNCTI
jgi:hypothetical protein